MGEGRRRRLQQGVQERRGTVPEDQILDKKSDLVGSSGGGVAGPLVALGVAGAAAAYAPLHAATGAASCRLAQKTSAVSRKALCVYSCITVLGWTVGKWAESLLS